MRIAFELSAEPRNDQGKGASRRLRHSGKVPAILYGAHAEPVRLSLEHHKLLPLVADEKFYSSIISVNVGAQKQPVIVKDVQMHPARNAVVHLDLQRVLENEKIRLHLPIHFKGEAASPGVKTQGGVVSHHMADMEVVCLPKDLPEYIELDLSAMNLNDTLYLDRHQGAGGRDDLGAGARRQSAGGLDPCAACGRTGTDCRSRRRTRRGRRGCSTCRGRSCASRGCQEGRRQEGRGQGREEGRRQEVAAQAGAPPRCSIRCRERREPIHGGSGRERCRGPARRVGRAFSCRPRCTWQCVRVTGLPLKLVVGLGNPGRRVRAHAAQRGLLVRR